MFPGVREWLPFPVIVDLALVTGLLVHLHLAKRFSVDRRQLFVFVVLVGIVAAAGAKVFSMVLDGPRGPFYGLFSPNYRHPGAVLALLVAAPWLRRFLPAGLTLWGCFDLMVPGMCFILALYRIQCLIVGCCMGGVCTLPWALRFPTGSEPWLNQVVAGQLFPMSATESLPVHPLALYFMVLALVLGFVFLRLLPRKAYDGQLLLLFLIFHELGKFLLEFLRVPRLPAVQVVSLVVGLGAVVIYVAIALRGHRKLETKETRTPL
jgi:phosphatidylglycerol:prolipoprotein diacylglycerol transferase